MAVVIAKIDEMDFAKNQRDSGPSRIQHFPQDCYITDSHSD